VQDRQGVEAVLKYAADAGQPCHEISAVSGEGIQELVHAVGARLDSLTPVAECLDD
jgi:hypothetical protein